MLDPPRRRLSLSDASILIAATALGLVMARYVVGLNLMAISPTPGDRAARIERIWMVTIWRPHSTPIEYPLALGLIKLPDADRVDLPTERNTSPQLKPSH